MMKTKREKTKLPGPTFSMRGFQTPTEPALSEPARLAALAQDRLRESNGPVIGGADTPALRPFGGNIRALMEADA